MANSPAFDWLCEQLQLTTDLDRLEARGTVRIALKSAGLDAGTVSSTQMRVVVEKVLPGELVARGIADADSLCSRLSLGVSSVASGDQADSPDAVFSRLGRS
ncbi:MAG: hypothetical protein AB8G23_09325 [Myxococcota bacterium]